MGKKVYIWVWMFVVLASAAQVALAAQKIESRKVLAIGNSFSVCLTTYFPEVVKSAGCEVVFEHLTIGGCTLEQHWSNIQKEASDSTYRRFKEYTYQEKLQSKAWDVVSIQQASPLSWRPESFFPHAQLLKDFVKQNAPTAEVVLQQTWSYRPDDKRMAEWGLTQDSMDEKIAAACSQAAEKLAVRQIPVGRAVRLARKNFPSGYQPFDRNDFTYPNLPKMDGFLCGNLQWNEEHTALVGDAYHLNMRGKYLQACVWFAELYGRSTEEITFVPEGMTDSDAQFLRKMAQAAVDGKDAP